MFEIRVICEPEDEGAIAAALATVFHTSTPRSVPSRDGRRTRLYLTAMPQREAENAYLRRIRAEDGPEAACLAAEAVLAERYQPENL